ncbi:MAG: NHL domain-containing protein [Steroidobacteraceae bacterium]
MRPVPFRSWPGRWAVCMLAAVALTACGGGGGGSTGSGTGSGSTTFTVGGTVSGLSASGLVLTDNGGDNLTLSSGATTFTFSQALASGASYSVAVATQPTGESCTVSGGSGTATANVTSVAVTCAVNTYTIGGTVTGLTASGLILADNGGNDLSLAAGATKFTFTQAVNSGAAYNVTIVQQPTGETCTVSSGSGTASANVTSVSVACQPAAYTVGGSITGLTASGLVLQNNAADNLGVTSGATTFTFSQTQLAGTPYSVTVYQQPTGETCAVSSGSGTISGSVSNVSVTCATAMYSITGSASGLTTAGLKLQFYSAGSVQAVTPVTSGSAPYTYSNVPYGTTVALTIAAQPGWATCTAVAGNYSGTVTGDVTGENLTCTADTPTASSVPTTGTTLNGPDGIAVDASGNLFVADTTANEVLKISSSGAVTQLGGSASPAFNAPDGVAVDSHGNVYVADTGNNLVREIVASGGVVSSSSAVITLNQSGAAAFDHPEGVAVDASGNVYVADTLRNEIREIEATGGSVSASSTIVTLAGNLNAGCVDGDGSGAEFDGPDGVAVDASDNLYVADTNNHVVRKITSVGPTGLNAVTTFAGGQGTCNGPSPASSGYEDGAGSTQALFAAPTGVTVDSAGNVFVSDLGNSAVRQITPLGLVSTLAGASNPTGGTTTPYAFNLPFGITVDGTDNLFVTDTGNNTIVKLAP